MILFFFLIDNYYLVYHRRDKITISEEEIILESHSNAA